MRLRRRRECVAVRCGNTGDANVSNFALLLLMVIGTVFLPMRCAATTTDWITAFDNLGTSDSYNKQSGLIIGTSNNWGNGPVFLSGASGILGRVDAGFGAVDPGVVMSMTLYTMNGNKPGDTLDHVDMKVPAGTASEAVLSFTGWSAEIAEGGRYFLQARQQSRGSFWGMALLESDIGESRGEFRVRDGVPQIAGPLHLSVRVLLVMPSDPTMVPVPPGGALFVAAITLLLIMGFRQRVFSVSRRVT